MEVSEQVYSWLSACGVPVSSAKTKKGTYVLEGEVADSLFNGYGF